MNKLAFSRIAISTQSQLMHVKNCMRPSFTLSERVKCGMRTQVHCTRWSLFCHLGHNDNYHDRVCYSTERKKKAMVEHNVKKQSLVICDEIWVVHRHRVCDCCCCCCCCCKADADSFIHNEHVINKHK